jgi:integrase/recombinase XerD
LQGGTGVRAACSCFTEIVIDTKVSSVRRCRSRSRFLFDRQNRTARQGRDPAFVPPGFRGGDVVRLRLTDIDWENGKIKVCGKGRRHELLPLPQQVGKAILRYLKKSRPTCRASELFVTVPPPYRKLSYQAVGGIVRRAIDRAGVSSPACGAHVLRYSAATTMLRQGASLASIGSVLRHRSPQTTTRYAKVDIGMLSTIAQSWPGVASC